jgi:hypothetical protein
MFSGEFFNGLANGNGRVKVTSRHFSGHILEGQWNDGTFSGVGIWVSDKGAVFMQGTFDNGFFVK